LQPSRHSISTELQSIILGFRRYAILTEFHFGKQTPSDFYWLFDTSNSTASTDDTRPQYWLFDTSNSTASTDDTRPQYPKLLGSFTICLFYACLIITTKCLQQTQIIDSDWLLRRTLGVKKSNMNFSGKCDLSTISFVIVSADIGTKSSRGSVEIDRSVPLLLGSSWNILFHSSFGRHLWLSAIKRFVRLTMMHSFVDEIIIHS
jgi:hypothetical protein